MRRASESDGLRITKVGLWFALLAGVVFLAATNTGNNGLYLVLAVMLGSLLVSHLVASLNVRRLDLELTPPSEIFANRPATFDLEIAQRGAWMPRWLLMASIDGHDLEPPPERRQRASSQLIPRLAPGQKVEGRLELLLRRRGPRRLRHVRVSSLFPLGFFRKGRRYRQDLELLVYPEIFTLSLQLEVQTGKSGETPIRRVGAGQELLGLRPFRTGDDPRGIHWKQSARIGQMIFKEHQSEEARRMSIVFDNAVGTDLSAAARARFERLVSEAATAALDYLQRGWEVELVTRDRALAFRGGVGQRRAILETLALVAPCERRDEPLQGSIPTLPHLRLAMEVA